MITDLPRAVILVVTIAVALIGAGSARAAALVDLTPGFAVNDDPLSGIDPAGFLSPTFDSSSDNTGGALVGGAPRAPWAAFSHLAGGDDQVFVRAFVGGQWVTRGHGTVGGLSSASPLVTSSLNFSDDSEAEQPAIDFAGAGRTVPWAVWAEHNGRLPSNGAPAHAQIFASRLHPVGDAVNPDRWEFAGQDRAAPGAIALPSLNLHVDRDAAEPSVAGGSVVDPAAPGPWVAWREDGAHAPGTDVAQIYVARPSAPDGSACDPTVRLGDQTGGTALGDTCFGQVGAQRLGGDPSLNVDRTRAASDPDIAFAGASDTVPWVVWREHGPTQTTGDGQLQDNSMIFAAKGIAAATGAPGVDGGLTWRVVGSDSQGDLDAGATGGSCASDALSEALCTLNINASGDAFSPRIAPGTMTTGSPTVPWITWAESNGTRTAIFVARLVGTGADAHFELADRGHQLGFGALPDITFSGHTPYVSWVGDDRLAHTGHFTDPTTFVTDHVSASETFQRPPLTSLCTPDPFTADGSACPGTSLGTPFVQFDDTVAAGDPPIALRGATYPAGDAVTGDATAVTDSTAVVAGVVTPRGTRATARIEYGPTTAYGSQTPARDVPADGAPVTLDEQLTGLPAATTLHYRLVASNDLTRAIGADRTFVTTAGDGAPPEPPGPSTTVEPPPAPSPPVVSPEQPTAPVVSPVPPITPVVTPGLPTTPLGPTTTPIVTGHAPVLRLVSFAVHRADRRVRARVDVDGPATISIAATLKGSLHHRTVALTLGHVTARYGRGGRHTVSLTLTSTARHALRTWRTVRISISAKATSARGTTTVRRTVAVAR